MNILPDVKYLRIGKNVGFAGGINFGLKKAIEDNYLDFIIVNNDILFPKEGFSSLLDFGRKSHKIGIISPKIYFAKGFEFHKKRYKDYELGKVLWYAGGIVDWRNVYAYHRGVDEVDLYQYHKPIETDYATGCFMYIKKEVFDKVGYFDEKYFMYLEDADFSIRAKKRGFSVYYYPDNFIWHKNAVSSEGAGSDLHVYYQTRNRMYFGMKYASFSAKKSLIWESIKFIMKDEVRRHAIFDYYFSNMGKRQV